MCRMVAAPFGVLGERVIEPFVRMARGENALHEHNEALGEFNVRQVLIHTGQHYDAALSQVFFDELGLPEPDRYLGVGSGSHGVQTARLLEALEREFVDLVPDGVIVYGDVNYTQPFLNNMHITTPTLFYLEHLARPVRKENGLALLDCEDNLLVVRPV